MQGTHKQKGYCYNESFIVTDPENEFITTGATAVNKYVMI